MRSKIDELSRRLRGVEDDLLVLETENRVSRDKVDKLSQAIDKDTRIVTKSDESIEFITLVAQQRRSDVKARIEVLIKEALHNVYGSEYGIVFDYTIKNRRSHVEVELTKQTPRGEVHNDIDGFGLGVADTVAFPLKLVVLMALKEADKVLLTDEPAKHIDVDRVERFAEFARQVAESKQVQLIMCSHHVSMVDVANTVYQLTDIDGTSKVKKLK